MENKSTCFCLPFSAMNKKIINAKIACIDFSLNKEKMKLGIQVLVNDPAKLEAIRQREADITKVSFSVWVHINRDY